MGLTENRLKGSVTTNGSEEESHNDADKDNFCKETGLPSAHYVSRLQRGLSVLFTNSGV